MSASEASTTQGELEKLVSDLRGLLASKDLDTVPEIKLLRQRLDDGIHSARESAIRAAQDAARQAKDAALAADRFTLLAGTRWETEGCIADSGKPGAVVLILGGVHGNEPAGALAAAQVCTFQPAAGKIVAVPRVNMPGLAAKLRYAPNGGGDMNRRSAARRRFNSSATIEK